MSLQRQARVPGSVASPLSPRGFRGDRPGPADSRWTPAWHVVFAVMLLAFTAVVLADRPAAFVAAVTVALAALLAGWYAYWMMRRPDLVTSSTASRTAYFTVAAVLWFSLATLSPNYANLGIVALGQLFTYLRPKWALVGAVIVLLLWLAGFGLDGSLAAVGTLQWHGTSWSVVAGTTLGVALLAICLYSFRELSSARWELAAAERQAGILAERQRIAGDIHDTLTQGLASVVMLLEAAQAAYQAGQPDAGRRIEEAARTARAGLRDVRRLVWNLRPEALERGTLREALERLTAELGEQTGVAAQVVVTGEAGVLPPRVEETLLRVAQEALANVRRHARAQEVTITLSYMEEEVALDVQDNGQGFDPAMLAGAGPGGGLGLTAMRERLESLGGSLTVESAPGEGTTMVAQLPGRMPAQRSIPALSGTGEYCR